MNVLRGIRVAAEIHACARARAHARRESSPSDVSHARVLSSLGRAILSRRRCRRRRRRRCRCRRRRLRCRHILGTPLSSVCHFSSSAVENGVESFDCIPTLTDPGLHVVEGPISWT